MPRYIDANKIVWSVINNDKYGTITKNVFVSLLQNADTEDVAPVVHGVWLDYRGCVVQFDDDGCPLSECKCSICNDWLTASDEYACKGNYCPNCGAKMDG